MRQRHAAAKRAQRGSFSGSAGGGGGGTPASTPTTGRSSAGSPRSQTGGGGAAPGFDHLWAASAQSHEAALHHEAHDEALQARRATDRQQNCFVTDRSAHSPFSSPRPPQVRALQSKEEFLLEWCGRETFVLNRDALAPGLFRFDFPETEKLLEALLANNETVALPGEARATREVPDDGAPSQSLIEIRNLDEHVTSRFLWNTFFRSSGAALHTATARMLIPAAVLCTSLTGSMRCSCWMCW